ncbi:hypothetical protein H5399_14400 [Tessaracoccus sp. MC1627]|uniref:hypothetical protein n=1 Tax=Tessaracoccus sp. MC1627 TaxID=2760312 RepID=UPI001603C038|nr:hypothetical protein [Tessaracoccus sp. MC1627]MBB1513781.1 hypothetical protein [Tessaracoccus sp. MC1627]
MARWLDAANASFAIGGFAAGGALGWWAGSFATCAAAAVQCQASVDAIAAVGTWVGGLGTVGAVIYAAATLRRDEQLRTTTKQRETSKLTVHAANVTLKIRPTDYDEQAIRQIGIWISNPPGDYPLHNVRVSIPAVKISESMASIEPGNSSHVLCELRPPIVTDGYSKDLTLRNLENDLMLEFQIDDVRCAREFHQSSLLRLTDPA